VPTIPNLFFDAHTVAPPPNAPIARFAVAVRATHRTNPRLTAQTAHAVLGEHTSRNLLYVALTRGRDTNTAYLYERQAGETEHEHADQQPSVHVARRGTGRQAAQLVRAIIANRDERARTAHDTAAQTQDRGQLPEQVQRLLTGRDDAVHARRTAYARWRDDILDERIERQRVIIEHLSRNHGIDSGLEL
jgi:ATP-dependent exoDNAse (exonuclease V) beta subunit